jgi:hypothetical protein
MADSAKRRLRLAQVVTRMDIGGVPDHVMTLIRGLMNDYDITLICGEIDDLHRRELVASNVAIESIPFERLLNPACGRPDVFRAVVALPVKAIRYRPYAHVEGGVDRFRCGPFCARAGDRQHGSQSRLHRAAAPRSQGAVLGL